MSSTIARPRPFPGVQLCPPKVLFNGNSASATNIPREKVQTTNYFKTVYKFGNKSCQSTKSFPSSQNHRNIAKSKICRYEDIAKSKIFRYEDMDSYIDLRSGIISITYLVYFIRLTYIAEGLVNEIENAVSERVGRKTLRN